MWLWSSSKWPEDKYDEDVAITISYHETPDNLIYRELSHHFPPLLSSSLFTSPPVWSFSAFDFTHHLYSSEALWIVKEIAAAEAIRPLHTEDLLSTRQHLLQLDASRRVKVDKQFMKWYGSKFAGQGHNPRGYAPGLSNMCSVSEDTYLPSQTANLLITFSPSWLFSIHSLSAARTREPWAWMQTQSQRTQTDWTSTDEGKRPHLDEATSGRWATSKKDIDK